MLEGKDKLNEFKADHENSSVADPVSKGSVKRPADKDGGEKSPIKQGSSDIKVPEGSSPAASVKLSKEDIDVSDAIEAIFDGEEFSEEFIERATIALQAAVFEAVNNKLEEVSEVAESILDEQTEALVEKIDGYLDLVVDNYMEENAIAIERGIKTEITESFLEGLMSLFQEHYIDIPEEKVDVVEALVAKTEELEEKLNKTLEQNVELVKENEQFRVEQCLVAVSDDLTDLQAEKLKVYAESVEFESEEDFVTKLEVIKETYFGKKGKSKVEALVEDDSQDSTAIVDDDDNNHKNVDPNVAHYASAISRSLKSSKL